MHKLTKLNKIIASLLNDALSTKKEYYDALSDLYNGGDFIKKFINDVQSILDNMYDYDYNGSNTIKAIIECLGRYGEVSYGGGTKVSKNRNNNACVAVIYAIKLLGRIMRSVLMRITLLTCNSACGLCYVNSRSCSRFSAPFIQARTLDRRVLKILASEYINAISKPVGDFYSSDVGSIVDKGGKDKALNIRCEP